MLIKYIVSMHAKLINNEWLQTHRNMVAFWVSLVLLTVVMSTWWKMFIFAKSTVLWPRWSYIIFYYPFIFTSDIVLVCLLPVALIPEKFSVAFLYVLQCVLISVLIHSFVVVITTTIEPWMNGVYNYVFVFFFHCYHPIIIVLFFRVIIRWIYRRVLDGFGFNK
jgi:hypothetical protein